jgi:hypothetical protein
MMAGSKVLDRHLPVIGDHQQLPVPGSNRSVSGHGSGHPLQQALPVPGPEQDDWEMRQLAGLDQRQAAEQLIDRAEASRKAEEATGETLERELAREEEVEPDFPVEVPVSTAVENVPLSAGENVSG